MAANETFLIPIDHENYEDSMLDESLVFDLINGRQKAILKRDFSVLEEGMKKIKEDLDDYIKE
jgi:hypothetical protein